MSHVVVAIFIGVAALLLWLVRSPRRTWPIAVAVGTVGVLLTAVWTVPLARPTGVHAEHALREGLLHGQLVQAPVLVVPARTR